MTLQLPKHPQFADRDIPDTEVIAVPAPSPVFVDATGRRRRVLRRLAYAFGALCMLYGGLVSVSLAGGPISSSAILPLTDLPISGARDGKKVEAVPVSTPAPSAGFTQRPRLLADALRPGGAPRTTRARTPETATTSAAPRPVRSAAPTPSPSKPRTESVPTKPSTSASPSTSDTPDPGTSTPVDPAEPGTPANPAPPAPPVRPSTGSTTSSGGAGGGGGSAAGSGSSSNGSGGGAGGGTVKDVPADYAPTMPPAPADAAEEPPSTAIPSPSAAGGAA